MSQSRFFEAPSGMTVGEIVALTGAQPQAGTDLSHRISNIAPLDGAGAGDVSYIESSKYRDALKSTRAGACFMTERFEPDAPKGVIVLVSREPHRDFTNVARKMHDDALRPASLFGSTGVAPGAFVHPSAKIGAGASVDPGAVVGPHAEIGAGTAIAAGAVIGPQVRVGRDCSIGANSTITHTTMGDRVIVHPGCHIGQDGFGYVGGAKGHLKIPQIGSVVIGDDVEIGAATTIDRGGFRDTVIGDGTKIDNLVQIGHNVVVGRHCIIVALAGISGSVTIEDFALIGGMVGIAPHVTVGKGAKLAARAGVISDIPPGQTYGGMPAIPQRRWMRQQAMVAQLTERGKQIDSPPISGAGQSDDAPNPAPPVAPTRQR
jgi:UDP-3-O-[3-hydroxymyristoyl] glucosamine N-acyltransferase